MAPSLPFEVWHDVVVGLDQADLAAVSLVSTNLQLVVESLLYAKFSWIPAYGQYSDWMAEPFGSKRLPSQSHVTPVLDEPHPRLHLFLRTILNRPHLASLVRSFNVMTPLSPSGKTEDCVRFWGSNNLSLESHFTSTEIAAGLSLIDDLGLCPRQEWRRGFRGGRCDVITALLLSRLHRIGLLEIRLRSHSHCHSKVPPVVGDIDPSCSHILQR